jgi:hypothetical protein
VILLGGDPPPLQPFLLKLLAQFVTHRTERFDTAIRRSSGGIRKRPMQAFHSGRDDGTDFVGAERDHEVGVLDVDGIDGLGRLRQDVDADFGHHGNRLRIHARRLTAGALNVNAIAEQMARQAFCHLASSGIGDAEKDEPCCRHLIGL